MIKKLESIHTQLGTPLEKLFVSAREAVQSEQKILDAVKRNSVLWERIAMFEAVSVGEVKSELDSQGIRVTPKVISLVLGKHGVTFTWADRPSQSQQGSQRDLALSSQGSQKKFQGADSSQERQPLRSLSNSEKKNL